MPLDSSHNAEESPDLLAREGVESAACKGLGSSPLLSTTQY